MADTRPQGPITVAAALRELTKYGYYRGERVRRPDATFVTETDVYDTPQAGPAAIRPGPYEGLCRPCAGADTPAPETVEERARTATRGRALVRAALTGARA
jgi:hypothetical protein